MLTAAHRYGCKVLLASTSEVYGKGVRVPFREDDDRLMGPTTRSRWAYAESKAVDEFLGLAYHHQFGLPVVIMRFFNTVGPRQTGRYGMVGAPLRARGAARASRSTSTATARQSRCFADVADVTRAIAQLADHPGRRARCSTSARPRRSPSAAGRAGGRADRQRLRDPLRALRRGLCARLRGHAAPRAQHRQAGRADRLRAAI